MILIYLIDDKQVNEKKPNKESLTEFLSNSPFKDSAIDLSRSKEGSGRATIQCDEDLIAEEEALVAEGLMRLPITEKNDDFLDFPAPQVNIEVIRNVIREERDETDEAK